VLPPEVSAVLDSLLAGVREVLGERCVGLHLYGSLATGDFDPDTSDIDFLVVTEGDVRDDDVAALAAMHAELKARGGPYAALEGSHIRAPRCAAGIPRTRHPHLSHERRSLEEHGADWVIQRLVLREHGVGIAGPAPREWIDPVTPSQLRAAIVALLGDFWAGHGSSDEFLRPRAYQVFAVQTMCRALHALAHGGIVSKPAAARWAREALPTEFRPAIERALAWPRGDQHDDPEGTRALIRFARERARRA
jgi:predicted nucleotidyltransferase